MKHDSGFTAVELIITLVVGSVLLLTAYQLYSFVVNDSADTRQRATASNLAYRFMRENASQAVMPCIAKTITPAPTIPASANLPNATASVVITCPTNVASIPLVTSTITYGSSKVVSHATYVFPD